MKAAVLEDVEKLVVCIVPDPTVPPREVAIRVKAVGVCGTDLHLYRGHANYNMDAKGRLVPLTEQPQILGHEFSGEIVEVGREVKDLRPGDFVFFRKFSQTEVSIADPASPEKTNTYFFVDKKDILAIFKEKKD